ncbi:uncharacterized protein LOC142996441 isoform X2 [Genypterus blacodes]|uniref:uncharacterized protein LOC142996441 isoform X2 n=1 Tax=Genypterus blacodes TaxID=154954 RepID=UPI003F764C83
MKLILTLIFTLTTGFDVSSEEIEVKGCPGGWVEFICAYKITETTQGISLSPKGPTTFSTQTDVWEKKKSFYLFNDSRERKLRVAFKKSTQKEDKYKCSFSEKKSNRERSVKVELIKAKNGCQDPSTQIAYRTAKTGITCKHPGRNATGMFFCKETETVCEDILSTTSSTTVSTNKKGFALESSSNDFNLTISNVTKQHAGDYWCGVVFRGGHRATIQKISLRVEDIRNFTRRLPAGQNLIYWCEYKRVTSDFKFICKGDDPFTCQHLTTTKNPINTTRFEMKEARVKPNITISVRDVTREDSGTYWCGGESADSSRTFYHMLVMIVESPHTVTPSVISSSSSSSSYPTAATSPVSPDLGSDDSYSKNDLSHI